jgi:hypothetical protein
MLAVPASAMFALGTLAHRRVAVTCVVFKDAPFHCTMEEDEKYNPVAVKVKLPPPATALVGDTLLKTGSVFLAGPTLIRVTPSTGAFFESATISGTASQTNTRTRYNVVFIKASPG